MKKAKFALMMLAVSALLVSGTAGAAVNLSPNFCAAFSSVYTNELLASVIPEEFAPLFENFNPAIADLNGTSVVDTNADPIEIDINGNGMLDCSVELKVLQDALSNASLNLPNGLTNAMAVQAWTKNWNSIESALGPTYAALAPTLLPGLIEILVGYVTLGGGTFTEDPVGRYEVTGAGGFIQALLTVLAEEGIIAIEMADLSNTQYWMPLTGYTDPCGDADHDGVKNVNEFHGQFGNATNYLAATINAATTACAVDPINQCGETTNPCGGAEGEGEGEAGEPFLRGGGWYEVGNSLTLQVVGAVPPATFAWKKDGAAVGSGGVMFTIPSLTLADAGTYTVDVTDMSAGKAVYTLMAPVNVYDQGSLPVAAVGGLALAAFACAAAGAFVLRRK